MFRSQLNPLLRQFLLRLDTIMSPSGLNLGVLWRAERNFREKWDPEREDFLVMLKEATDPLAEFRPVSGDYLHELVIRPNNEPGLRSYTEELFADPEADAQTRLEIIRRYGTKNISFLGGASHFQDLPRNELEYALTLLTLRYPENSWFYCESSVNRWLSYMGFDCAMGIGLHFSLDNYSRLCSSILEQLQENPAVLKVLDPIREQYLGGYQDNGRFLVFALLYASDVLYLYEEAGLMEQNQQTLELMEEIRCEEESLHNWERKYLRAVRNYILPDMTGSHVRHRVLGRGLVTRFENNRFQVRFANESRTFGWEDILVSGDVFIDRPSFRSPMLMGFQARRRELENRRLSLKNKKEQVLSMETW